MGNLDKYFDSGIHDMGGFSKFIRPFAVHTAGALINLVYRVEYYGLDKVPENGVGNTVVIAGNHSSYLDPCLVFKAIWNKELRVIAKEPLFEHKVLGRIISALGAFPVYKRTGNRSVLKRSVKCLKRGEHLLIFPEGTRIKERNNLAVEFTDGVALIAKMADVAILPVGIEGALDVSPDKSKRIHFPKIKVRFGDPVYWKDFSHLEKHEMLSAVTEEVRVRVRALERGIDVEEMRPLIAEALEAKKAAQGEHDAQSDADAQSPSGELGE